MKAYLPVPELAVVTHFSWSDTLIMPVVMGRNGKPWSSAPVSPIVELLRCEQAEGVAIESLLFSTFLTREPWLSWQSLPTWNKASNIEMRNKDDLPRLKAELKAQMSQILTVPIEI